MIDAFRTPLIVPVALLGAALSSALPACSSAPVVIPRGALGDTEAAEQDAPTWIGADGSQVGARGTVEQIKRTVPAPDPNRPKFNDASPMGTNLGPVKPTARDRVFVDLFKLATPWVSVSETQWDDGRPIALDAQGWVRSLEPRQQVGAQMSSFNGGRFAVLYDGRGVIRLEGRVRLIKDSPGRLEFSADPDTTINLILGATNPSNPVRNLRVLPEGLADLGPERPFHPRFLRAARVFSTLRFVGWTRPNDSRAVRWEERTETESARQTSDNGVAYEYMIQLANELGADLWIPIPIRADDDHVRSLAELISVNLAPELKVYLEFGDRMLTPGTAGFRFGAERGRALTSAGAAKAAAVRFYVERSRVVFKTFEAVFGGRRRLVRVIAGDSRDPESLTTAMTLIGGSDNADLLAVDTMVGEEIRTPTWQSKVKAHDVPWLLDQLEQDSLPPALARVAAAQQIAEQFGVGLASYSAGLSLTMGGVTGDSHAENRPDLASRHQRVEGLYGQLLDGWRAKGGQLIVHTALASRYGRRGRLGAIEDVDNLNTSKYRALLSFIQRAPKWWTAGRKPPAANSDSDLK